MESCHFLEYMLFRLRELISLTHKMLQMPNVESQLLIKSDLTVKDAQVALQGKATSPLGQQLCVGLAALKMSLRAARTKVRYGP